MLGSGKARAVRAFVTGSSPRSQDADPYRHYAAALYVQALLTRRDPALAEHVVCDVIANEAALAAIPERGEDDARYRPTESVLRRCLRLVVGPAWQARRPGHIRVGGAAAIYPRDMAAFLHAVMRRLAYSSAAVAEDGSQVEARACSGMRDINAAGRCCEPAEEQEENDADARIPRDDHHGSRRSGAWAGGGQIAAGYAAVRRDEENVI
jgi:hypothetical protein